MSASFVPAPPNAAWQQPVDLLNEDLLEQEELAYEEELKAIYVQEVSYNYGIECREENYQDDEEMEDAEEYDEPPRQGDRDVKKQALIGINRKYEGGFLGDDGMDVQQ